MPMQASIIWILTSIRISTPCSYGLITVLSYLSLPVISVIPGVHLRCLDSVWFTTLNLSTAHPSLHRSLVIRRPK